MTAPLPEPFTARYDVNTSPCWVWNGGTQSKGYGSVTNGRGGSMLAHRAVWESIHGPIPDDMTVDHICRNKLCGRPDHLRLLTRGDNLRAARQAIRFCPAGHEYTDANTRRRGDRRECRTCQREQQTRRRAAAKESA